MRQIQALTVENLKPSRFNNRAIYFAPSMSASRTAALSRYLAALNEGSAPEGRVGSVQTAPEMMVNAKTMDKTGDPKCHNVVVKPLAVTPRGGLSFLEVAVSKNRANTNEKPQIRSRSVGRGSARTSRDVVQEVYDRMGVSREDLTETSSGADKFQQRYRAAAVISVNSPNLDRGRVDGSSQTDGNRRARSLSRGESMSRRWPPDKLTESETQNAAPTIVKSVEINGANDLRHKSPHRISVNSRSNENQAAGGKPLKNDKKEEASLWKGKEIDQVNSNHSSQQDEQEEDQSEDSAIPSVKERMRAFHQPKPSSARSFQQVQPNPLQYAKKRDHPPKIDKNSNVKRIEVDQVSPMSVKTNSKDRILAPEPSYILPSPAAAAAADAAADLVRRQHERWRGSFGFADSDKVSDSIAALPNPTPVIEITGADASGGMNVDMQSVAMSDFSHYEFPASPTRSIRDGPSSTQLRSTWADRSHVSVNNAYSVSNGRSITGPVAPTSEMFERIVEERLRVRISDLEKKMTTQMVQLENRMEEKMKARMEALESKIDTLGHMLALVVSNNSGREEI